MSCRRRNLSTSHSSRPTKCLGRPNDIASGLSGTRHSNLSPAASLRSFCFNMVGARCLGRERAVQPHWAAGENDICWRKMRLSWNWQEIV
jgi:hypothetical protein